ncbi:MAG TPA: DUF1330 domain-containing protein [Chthoniobacterales bacterium]|nr:DUF1330 domain-containing protein [Chthoniobacterales bacterium]
MSAYVIVEIDIFDPVGFGEYRKAVVPLVQKYGGKYVAVDDQIETLEGDWSPKRIVVIEFPSMERAKDWFGCKEYREPCKIRKRTANTKMILVEGV